MVPRVFDSYEKTHNMVKAMGGSMAKPMVPRVYDSYGKIHGMAKAMGVSMAKPIVPRVCDSYGKTHGMANAMGVSMAKPMGLNFSILTMLASTMETADMPPTKNSEGSFIIFVGSNWTNLLTYKKGCLN